jgi:hypothetical protein
MPPRHVMGIALLFYFYFYQWVSEIRSWIAVLQYSSLIRGSYNSPVESTYRVDSVSLHPTKLEKENCVESDLWSDIYFKIIHLVHSWFESETPALDEAYIQQTNHVANEVAMSLCVCKRQSSLFEHRLICRHFDPSYNDIVLDGVLPSLPSAAYFSFVWLISTRTIRINCFQHAFGRVPAEKKKVLNISKNNILFQSPPPSVFSYDIYIQIPRDPVRITIRKAQINVK